ncbi:YisL family protein [Gracilibacillus sp. S3-1-1]|uniref:YisL family protein n=1 Tax=Gracilibacillus pellucidus TaxID=3095368 RepID=A0ACC6M461_9BACI|nr:YisL family protein [Gracilibacillus sp. S3-1-1]MDX8045763.1 YisL family protein [Gracilibacillus sp. S3-1-1]
MTTHLHITAWVIGVILLLVSYAMYKSGNKAGKILHMILRLDYLLIIITGVLLFTHYFSVYTGSAGILGEVIVKMVAGLWMIGAMEMLLTKTSKAKPATGAWIQIVIAFVIVLVLGLGRLPIGFQFMG